MDFDPVTSSVTSVPGPALNMEKKQKSIRFDFKKILGLIQIHGITYSQFWSIWGISYDQANEAYEADDTKDRNEANEAGDSSLAYLVGGEGGLSGPQST